MSIRRATGMALMGLSLALSVIALLRGDNNCDPYDESLTYFSVVPPALLAGGVLLVILRKPREIGWTTGLLMGAALVAFFVFFSDLAGACAD